jgi:hypothetical protein
MTQTGKGDLLDGRRTGPALFGPHARGPIGPKPHVAFQQEINHSFENFMLGFQGTKELTKVHKLKLGVMAF